MTKSMLSGLLSFFAAVAFAGTTSAETSHEMVNRRLSSRPKRGSHEMFSRPFGYFLESLFFIGQLPEDEISELRNKRFMIQKCELLDHVKIRPEDLVSQPLITSRQHHVRNFITGWLGMSFSQLNVVATYNLLYNAAHLVNAGLGSTICIDGLIPAVLAEALTFRPFSRTQFD